MIESAHSGLVLDIAGQSTELGITVADDKWPELVGAATFEQMRGNARDLAPDPSSVLKDRSAFFRRGRSGAARELLTEEELALYADRTARLAPADLLTWLHCQ